MLKQVHRRRQSTWTGSGLLLVLIRVRSDRGTLNMKVDRISILYHSITQTKAVHALRITPCLHSPSVACVCDMAAHRMAAVVMIPGGASGRSAWHPSVLCLGCTACEGDGRWEPTGCTGTARRLNYPQHLPTPFTRFPENGEARS